MIPILVGSLGGAALIRAQTLVKKIILFFNSSYYFFCHFQKTENGKKNRKMEIFLKSLKIIKTFFSEKNNDACHMTEDEIMVQKMSQMKILII